MSESQNTFKKMKNIIIDLAEGKVNNSALGFQAKEIVTEWKEK